RVNSKLDQIKQLFPIKEFNLHKTGGKINSYTQSFAVLKKCLEICNVMYQIKRVNGVNQMRLIPKNFILENYINTQKMSDIHSESESKPKPFDTIAESVKQKEKIELKEIKYSSLLKSIIKEE